MNRHTESLSIYNIDYYYPLLQKRQLIERCSNELFKGNLLDLGCGTMPYREIIESKMKISKYIGVDIKNETYQKEIVPDFFWDGKQIPFENNYFDSSILIEVLEHTPHPDQVLKELYRVLTIGGTLLITVPFLWTLHDVPYDEYRYTPFALKRMLEEAGFRIKSLESFGNWNASLASFLALYCKRGLKSTRARNYLSKILLPVIKYLYKKDEHSPKHIFKEGQMVTGLWCIAEK